MKRLPGMIALILAIMMIILIASVPAAAQTDGYLVGDADGDGEITVLDATRIQRVLAKLVTDLDGMVTLRGDINGDGLDIMDATSIQRYIAKFNDNNRVGEYVALPTEPATEPPVETTAPTQPHTSGDDLPFVPV